MCTVACATVACTLWRVDCGVCTVCLAQVDVQSGKFASAAAVFDAVFAIVSTIFAAMFIFTCSSLRNVEQLKRVPGAPEAIGCLTSLVAGGLSLGVAAMYELASEEVLGLRRYNEFLRETAGLRLGPSVCGGEDEDEDRSSDPLAPRDDDSIMRVADFRLPSMVTLRFTEAVSKTTIFALVHLRVLERFKRRGLEDLQRARNEVVRKIERRGLVLLQLRARQLQGFIRHRDGWFMQVRATALASVPSVSEMMCATNAKRARRLTSAQRRRLTADEARAYVSAIAINLAGRYPQLEPVQAKLASQAKQNLLEIRSSVYELLEKVRTV